MYGVRLSLATIPFQVGKTVPCDKTTMKLSVENGNVNGFRYCSLSLHAQHPMGSQILKPSEVNSATLPFLLKVD